MGNVHFASAYLVEQGFRFMGDGIKFAKAYNTAVAFKVMKIAEQVVDSFRGVIGHLLKVEQSFAKMFCYFASFIDKIF